MCPLRHLQRQSRPFPFLIQMFLQTQVVAQMILDPSHLIAFSRMDRAMHQRLPMMPA